MSILKRFEKIMASNLSLLLKNSKDREKMIVHRLRCTNRDLGKVKSEKIAIKVEEQCARRRLDDCNRKIINLKNFVKKLMEANNEEEAQKLLKKKSELIIRKNDLTVFLEVAERNTRQMRLMNDKLFSDIIELEKYLREITTKQTRKQSREVWYVSHSNHSLCFCINGNERENRSVPE